MAFFLRFKPQLRRTRPELVLRIEEMAIRAVEEAGGSISAKSGLLQAFFNENSPAFWLDMLLLIEKLIQAVNDTSGELYGYSLLFGADLPENPDGFCCFLSGERSGGGVFLDKTAAAALRPYIALEEQMEWSAEEGATAFFRVKEIKIFVQTAMAGLPLRETSVNYSEAGQRQAILVFGRSYDGKRDELYRRFAGFSGNGADGEFPPLFIRFGRGGLNALTDAWADWMPIKDEMANCREFLFRQRLKPVPSPFAAQVCRRFFALLLDLYVGHANNAGVRPVVILENIHTAETTAAAIAIETLQDRKDFLLLGTCTDSINASDLQQWRTLFPRVLRSHSDISSRPPLPDISCDLWEIGYILSLLGRFFPPDFIPRLLQEAGKNPAVIARAISLLHALRIIDTPLDPLPWHGDFTRNAEAALGEKAKGLRELAGGIVLAWVKRRKISPCIRLLESLAELGCAREIDDSLILQALYCELSWGDRAALENACDGNALETIAGKDRAGALGYIFKTLISIHFGSAADIRGAFSSPPHACPASPLLEAQAHFNRSLYFFGIRDNDSALDAVKEAVQLCKGQGSPCMSHYYRIFALASLSQKRIGEAIDYLGFALENAAQCGGGYETGMAAYYAASVQLLHGNLTRARALAEKARRHFQKAGSPEWADRSCFLEGRIAFEAGYYRQAADIFDGIRSSGDGGSFAAKNAVLEAWAYRARLGSQNPAAAKPQAGGRDADIFVLEASYLAGDHSALAELSANGGNLPMDANAADGENFLFTEQPDWRSGFAQCELLYFSQAGLWERAAAAYRLLARSSFSPSGSEDDLRAMQKLLQNGEFPEIDPGDIFYHYAWCRLLEQTNASRVDVSTAVSVAYKRLQSRASRIDDSDTRRQYLTQPHWNKAISQAASEFNLV